MINAGDFNKNIVISSVTVTEDAGGFATVTKTAVLSCKAKVDTFSGSTLLANGTDFEKATTRFIIRKPVTSISRKMLITYNGKDYVIEYMRNVNNRFIEIQATEISK